jgi:hypothetical protein
MCLRIATGDDMSRSGGGVSTGGATRLVYTIGLIKWVTLGLIAVSVLGGTALSMDGDNPLGVAVSLIVWVYGAVAGLSVYVFMGWLQQTLLMLIGIAKNTAADGLLSRF